MEHKRSKALLYCRTTPAASTKVAPADVLVKCKIISDLTLYTHSVDKDINIKLESNDDSSKFSKRGHTKALDINNKCGN